VGRLWCCDEEEGREGGREGYRSQAMEARGVSRKPTASKKLINDETSKIEDQLCTVNRPKKELILAIHNKPSRRNLQPLPKKTR